MNVNVIFGKQTFVANVAKVTKVRKNTTTTIKAGGEVDKVVTFWIDLDNGQSIPAPLSAINRAVGRTFDEQSLILLHGGTITYHESNRIAGELFKWRPTDPDKSAVISTTDGVVHSIESMDVPDSRFQYLMTLPIYETAKVNSEVAEEPADEQFDDAEEVADDNDIPAGAIVDEAAKTSAAKTGGRKGANDNQF
jgi:hypothetical protein